MKVIPEESKDEKDPGIHGSGFDRDRRTCLRPSLFRDV
jgi:hypothetical protein